MLTVQNGEPPNESVPRAFYRELLTVFADVQYLKAEFAYWKAVQDQRAPKGARRRASERRGRVDQGCRGRVNAPSCTLRERLILHLRARGTRQRCEWMTP